MVHFAVFFNHKYWSTQCHNELDKCPVYLLYCGKLVFDNTRHTPAEECNGKEGSLQETEKLYDNLYLETTCMRRRRREKEKPKTSDK